MNEKKMSRRRALKVLGAVMLSGAAGQLLLATRAKAALAPAGPGLLDFIAVSRDLTGKPDPNPTLALGLYQALQAGSANLDGALAALKTTLAQGELALKDNALAQAIVQGWYLGVVGKGKKAVCVGYVDTLANQAVAGTLVPPSYSYGPCGAWQAQP